MQATELRIGNIVAYGQSQWKVSGIIPPHPLRNHYMIELWNNGLVDVIRSDLHSIPLTEEWLLRFGFESKNPVLFTNSDGDSFYLDDTKIKHVHQLQNLYFALTGEELTYNG